MNEWFIQKWRVKDLRINRLITYREGRESSYFTSWNRRPSLDVPRFPASPLGLCWRWGALSNGVCLSNELSGVKERGRNHWPKKSYFRRFPSRRHRKLWPGIMICSFTLNIQTFVHSYTCCAIWSHINTGKMRRMKIHALLLVFAKDSKITFKVWFGYVWMSIKFKIPFYLILHTVIHRGLGV